MSDTFNVIRQGAVLEVVFAPPFVLALPQNARAALVALLTTLPPDVSAVLVRAGAQVFASGPDLPRADDAEAPTLAQVCAAVEGCPIPLVFLVEGVVAGALAEVALAAQGRLSTPDGRMMIGAIALGLISGAGGTQRLASLVGAEQALRLMRAGLAVAAPEAVALGLIDQVIEAKRRVAVHGLARDLAEGWNARSPLASPPDARGFFATVADARLSARGEADRALVDCIEAATLLPRAQGLALEAVVAGDLAESSEAAALCHIHRAEQQLPKSGAASSEPVTHLGVMSAAPSLVGVVLSALTRGIGVAILETERAALVGFLEAIAARQESAVQSGQLSADQRDEAWDLLIPVTDAAGLSECALVIAGEGAMQASGPWPLLVCGHGPLPKDALRLTLAGSVAEVGVAPGADPEVVALATGFLRRLGLLVVHTGTQSAQGLSGRLAVASGAALRGLLALGVAPEAISAALTDFGMAAPSLSDARDLPPRAMEAKEIVNRVLGAMANEGARLLAAGMAASALDIDVVAVHALGFPRQRGGPLHHAERRGLLVVRRDLTLWAEDAEVWRPVPALDAFVSSGRGFGANLTTG